MNDKKRAELKEIMKEAMAEFIRSPKGEALIGQIVLKAVSQSLTREMEFEDGKTDRGAVIKTKKKVNVLDQIVYWLPHAEAAVRGCQADADKARNRATETRNLVAGIVTGSAAAYIENKKNQVLKIVNQGEKP